MQSPYGAHAQTTLPTTPQRDTSQNKSNTKGWRNIDPTITYETLDSRQKLTPDTSLRYFQRRPFVQPWYRDLGNPGSPACNLAFQPENRVGPTLGYTCFDNYRFLLPQLKYYNTTRPYSEFVYNLGSKLEQVAGIMHTQNVRPNFNFMVAYSKINAPGFYKIQRNNHDNFCLSVNYKGLKQGYALFAGMVYNKEQHDENGGIVADTQLTNAAYSDRRTLDVAYQNSQYSATRSTVSNVYRDFGVSISHGFTWGIRDTTYNKDSTELRWKLIPRFSITHRMKFGTEKHTYRDLAPDSLRYTPFFNAALPTSIASYYISGADSVYTRQKWVWVSNEIRLNGFTGRGLRQMQFVAGIGNRIDKFVSSPAYLSNENIAGIVSNYLVGEISKSNADSARWDILATGKLFVTGSYSGDFEINTSFSRRIGKSSSITAGFRQLLGSAPFNYTQYENKFVHTQYSFAKESQSVLQARFDIRNIRLSGGIRTHLISNFIYTNQLQTPDQYATAFTLNSVWLNKTLQLGYFYLDNELLYQQVPETAPVNVPAFMAKHQLCYDREAFKRKLKIVTGIEIRYNTAYHPAAYSAVLNRFYFQNSLYVGNRPECAVFFNFSFKHFRAFLMLDQVQQAFTKNAVLFSGAPEVNFYGDGVTRMPVYATQNTMIRFGFNWVLLN